MTTATVERETKNETPLYSTPLEEAEAKARRNAEYLAKIDRGMKELDEGKGITMTFAEWEEWIKG